MPTFRHRIARAGVVLAVAAVPASAALAPIEPAAVAALDRAFARAEAAAKAASREAFDPQAVLEGVGRDPATLAERVRTHTAYVPYRGTLRGPAAVSNLHAPGGDESAAATAAAKDHWWVQTQAGAAWADFDPTRPANAAALTASGTVALPQAGPPIFAAAHAHEIRVRLLVEQNDAGKLTEHAVLDQTYRPADLAGRGLTIIQTPIKGGPDVDLDKEKDPAAATAKMFRAQTQWLPVAVVGVDSSPGQAFDDGGNLIANPKLDKTAGLAGGTAGGFGGIGGMGDGEASSATLTAETIEYTVRSAGEPEVVIRRPLFDLLGPAPRAGGSIKAFTPTDDQRLARALMVAARIDVLALGGQIRPEFVSSVLNDDVHAIRKPLLASAKTNDFRPALARMSTPDVLYSLQLLRQAMAPRPERTYLDRPNILASYRSLSIKPDGQLAVRQSIDIASNPVAVRPSSGGDDAFAVRVDQGVADTAAERAALGGSDDTIYNAAELFARSGNAKLVAATTAALPDAVKALPGDVRQRIQLCLSEGNAVVLPPTTVKGWAGERFVWYRVDPKTGQTIGVNDAGLNGATVEQLIVRAMGRLQQAAGTSIICSCSSLWAAQTAEEFAANMGLEFGALSFEMQMMVSMLHAQMQAYIQRCMELGMY